MKKVILFTLFTLFLTTGCSSSSLVIVGGKYLSIIEEPEKLHQDLATIKVSVEEVGRLVKDHYSIQEKDNSYNELLSKYNSIKTDNDRLIADMAIRIKKNINIKKDDFQNRIDALKEEVEAFKALYSSEISGLSDVNLGGIIGKIGLDILKKLAKEQALRLYAKEFVKEYTIENFENLKI